METVLGSNIQANINNTFKDITEFYTDLNGFHHQKFLSDGNYLSSRANLSHPTSSIPNTIILTFNRIECEDERQYKCKFFLRTDGSFPIKISDATSIVVKGKYT